MIIHQILKVGVGVKKPLFHFHLLFPLTTTSRLLSLLKSSRVLPLLQAGLGLGLKKYHVNIQMELSKLLKVLSLLALFFFKLYIVISLSFKIDICLKFIIIVVIQGVVFFFLYFTCVSWKPNNFVATYSVSFYPWDSTFTSFTLKRKINKYLFLYRIHSIKRTLSLFIGCFN